jgi:hypothetical protein
MIPESFGSGLKSKNRFKIFKKNFSLIQKQNKKFKNIKFGVTPFADISDEEFESTFTSYIKSKVYDNIYITQVIP